MLENNYDYNNDTKPTKDIGTMILEGRNKTKDTDFDFMMPPKPMKKAVASSDEDFKF